VASGHCRTLARTQPRLQSEFYLVDRAGLLQVLLIYISQLVLQSPSGSMLWKSLVHMMKLPPRGDGNQRDDAHVIFLF
jgi:hypothetical protein